MTFNLSPLSRLSEEPSASTPRPQPRPAVRSHYRPHSTLCVEEPVQATTSNLRDSVLSRARRHSIIRRSVSLGETMGLGKKKATEQCKDKPLVTRMRTLTEIATPTPPTMSRPNTSAGGSSVSERSNGRGSALHRVKAQRSIGSLFAAAGADVSPNSVSPSEQIARPQLSPHSTLPPPTLRTRKMTTAASTRPRAVSAPRPKRHSRQEYENAMNAKKPDTNNWVTRSRTKVHPYAKEVPYMQAYDRPCLENDRYTQLLLERLNPGSPSFLEFGKKYPSSVLDLGCGQGEWCLYAASIWKNSRIVGFDLMDVTLPAFATTENLSFVQGNFLQKLPFPSKSFEYVRMANLSLCIPYSEWLSILNEVRRVLANGGRLELIDDQMIFPYGEEPQVKESSSASASGRTSAPLPSPETAEDETHHSLDQRVRSCRRASFFDFSSDDSEPEFDEADRDDAETSSTTSTLVSDRGSFGFYDKIPSWKRSSGQSARSYDSTASTTSTLNSEKRLSDPAQPITITLSATSNPLSEPTISPSPTVTQATFSALDESVDQTADLSQTPTVRGLKTHRKANSASSTKSATDAIVTWKHRKTSSTEMESIFEHVLIHNYGVHPRPSDFMVDCMHRVFGPGNAAKVKSFHIQLAPFDSPIGPGGALDPKVVSEEQKVDKKQKKEKLDQKERRREQRKIEKRDGSKDAFEQSQPSLVTVKAASRLGLVPTIPPTPPRRAYSESPASSENDSVSFKRSHKKHPSAELHLAQFPVVNAKAASRLGIPPTPPPVPPKSEAIKAAYIYPAKSEAREIPRPIDATVRPSPSRQTTTAEDAFSSMSITPTNKFRGAEQIERSTSGSSDGSTGSGSGSGSGGVSDIEQSSGNSSDVYSDGGALVPQPHGLSAKAAGRLGISYSVLAAASAAHSRAAGVMTPVQSPGILVWPSTYIPMTPAELEMHACKWLQALLGCRHAMREFITGPFNGERLVDDEGFDDAIWEYECFRRSRFHWPKDNPELFANNDFPEGPGPNAPNPTRDQKSVSSAQRPPLVGRPSNMEMWNGQYRRDELTEVRTIRVFEAVKIGDEKSLVSMLFRA